MLHSDYPLQALLYSVVLHRFLRWRQPRLPPRHASGRHALPVRARDVRGGHPDHRRPPGGSIQLAAARRAHHGAVGLARRRKGGGMTTVRCRRHRLLRPFSDAGVFEPVRCPCRTTTHGARRRTPTKPSHSRWPWWCARCAAARCAWTCASVADQIDDPELPWPDTGDMAGCGEGEPAGPGTRTFCRFHGDLLYLDRYWREEQQVADDLLALLPIAAQPVPADIGRLFPAGIRGAAGGRGNRSVARVDGTHGRPRHRQDHHGRAAAGVVRRAGGDRASRGCASRWRRRRARRRRGCRKPYSSRSTASTSSTGSA